MGKQFSKTRIGTLLSDITGGSTANETRKKWWGGPSRLITSRFAKESSSASQIPKQRTLAKAAPVPLVETLEPRILLNADISPWLSTLADGLDEVGEFLEDLENSETMNLTLPLLGTSMDDFVDLSDLVQDTIAEFNDVVDDIADFSDADTAVLMAELEGRLGATGSSFDAVTGITFTFEYDTQQALDLPFDIEGTSLDIGATANAHASFTIGVDFNATDSNNAFYVVFGDITMDVSANDLDVDASVNVGGTTAEIVNGTIDFNLVLDLDLLDPNTDGQWTLDEMDAVGTDAELPGVTFSTAGSSFAANLPLQFAAGDFESDNFVDATLVADVENIFDLQGDTVFELQAIISDALQLDIVAALDLADAALLDAVPQLNDLLEQEVPGMGQPFSELLAIPVDFAFDLGGADLSVLAQDYFAIANADINDGIEATFSGLMDALSDGLTAAGSSLIPVLDSDTLTISFDLAMDEPFTLSGVSFDAAHLGLDDFTGSASLSGDATLVGGLTFALDLDAEGGIDFSLTDANLGLEGELALDDISVTYALGGVSAAVMGSGIITVNSRVSAEDSNADGSVGLDELLAAEPEAELDVHLDLNATLAGSLGDLGDVGDISLVVDGSLGVTDGDVSSDLNMEIDFAISSGLQTTILDLMGDADQYLSLANGQIANGLGQTLPVINQTLAQILGLNDGGSLLPDVNFEQVTSEYFTSAGAGATMSGLITALTDALAAVDSALNINFNPESLGLDIGLSLDSAVIIEDQLLASSSLALGDFGGALAASGVFDLRGNIGINLGLSMAFTGDTGPSVSVTEVSMDVDLSASVDDFEATGDIAGIGGGVSGGSASLEMTGTVSAPDSNGDGIISVEEMGQLSRDVILSVDAVLPLVTTGTEVLGADGLIAPVVTVHSDDIFAGVGDDNVTYFVDFTIGSDLALAINKVLTAVDVVLDTALEGIAALLDQPMPGMGQTIGDTLGLTAEDVRLIDIDLATVYADLVAEKAAIIGALPDGETVDVTLRELLAAINDEIFAALAAARGVAVPDAIDGSEVSFFDGMFSVVYDSESSSLIFNVNIEEVLDTVEVDLDGSAFSSDLDAAIAVDIVPTLGLVMSATMPLDDPLSVNVDNWSASLELDVDIDDAQTSGFSVGPFGVTVMDGSLDLSFSVAGEALSPNEVEITVDPLDVAATDSVVLSGDLEVGGLLSGEFDETDPPLNGTYGSLSISAEGVWSYDLTSSPASGTYVDKFTLSNVDGESVTVAVTVSGPNDVVFPRTNIHALEVSDTSVITDYVGAYGTLHVFAGTGGSRDITYTLNSSAINDATSDPAIGENVSDSFGILQEDGSVETLTVDLTIPTSASYSFDVPEGHGFVPQTDEAEAYGAFSITAEGAWTYTLDTDLLSQDDKDELAAGENLVDEVTVTRANGDSETITVTINAPEETADPGDPEPADPSDTQITFAASIDGTIELDATIDGLGTAATLLFDVNSDNLFGDTGEVSGDVTDLATYADLAIDLSTIEYGYDMIIGADLIDWVMDQLSELDELMTDALDNIDDILDVNVPGLDKALGEVLGMELGGDGDYSLDVPFSLTATLQDYLDLVDESDDIEFPTVGGLFDYLKAAVTEALGFVSIYFDPDDFAFDFDVSLPFFASLEADWDLDLATLAGDDVDIFEIGNATASGHVSVDGALILDLSFGIDFVTTGDEPNVYFTEIAASADLNIDVDALNAGISVGPFDAGINNGTISVTVEFDSQVVADETDGYDGMSLSELSASAALEFNLDATFEAELPVDIAIVTQIGSPIFSLWGDLNLQHDGADGSVADGEFELAYSMDYSIDFEIKETLETVILDVVGAFGTLITDATDAVNDLLEQIVPGTELTIGDVLGIDVSEIALDLHAIAEDYFNSATAEDPSTMLGLLEGISVEIGKQLLPDLVGAVEDFINDGATMVFDELEASLAPYIGYGEQVDEALAALEEFFDDRAAAEAAGEPVVDITLSDIINLLKPVLANVISLIPGVDDDGQMRVDLSFNFDFGTRSSFDLTIDGLDFPIADDLTFDVSGQGTLSADLLLEFNLGLGLDLNDFSNISAYLYLPTDTDTGLPEEYLASLDASAALSDLGFGVTIGGVSAGVVGGSAEINLGLALEVGGVGAVDVTGRIDSGVATVDLVTSGDFQMELPFQLEAGGGGFELMAATVEDIDLFTGGFDPTFVFSTFEMPTIIDIFTNIDDRNMMFMGVDMVLAGLEDLLQTQFLDRLADVPMLGDALAEDGNFVGMIREQFDTVADALGGNTGIAFGNFIAGSLNQVFDDLEIFNSDGTPVIWVNLLYRVDNGDGTFSDHILSMGGNGTYMFDGVVKNNVDGGSLDGSGADVDFVAILANNTDNDFHAMEIQLDFHADLIAQLGLGALDLIPLSFNLGLDFLTLNSDAVLDLEFGLDINLALGLSNDEGIYIGYAADEQELGLTLTAYLEGADGGDASMTLELGFLSFSAIDNGVDGHGSGISGIFGINLEDPDAIDDGMLTWDELTGDDSLLVVAALLVAEGDIHLMTDMPVGIPELSVDFVFDQAIGWDSVDGMDVAPANLQFNNLELDLGSFFSEILLPILSSVQDALEPIEPIIDILTTPVPVLSDLAGQDLTMIDLAEIAIQASGKGKVDLSMLESILQIAQLILDIPTDSDTLIIDFGDFDLGGVSSGTDNSASISGAAAGNPSSGSVSDNSGSSSSSQGKQDKASGFMSSLSGVEGLDIPLLTDPSTLLGLLMGETVDLITYEIPGLEFYFEYRKDFLIVPQFMIWGGFFGEVELTADFAFGFDSYGIQSFMDGGSVLEIANGLYVSDNWAVDGDPNSDQPEVTLDVGIGVRGFGGLPGLVELGVYGGLFGHVELDLHDAGFGETGEPDGKIRIDEMINQLALGPLCLFDIEGSLEARLAAYFWMGIDLGWLGEVTLVDWEQQLFSITILEFELDCTPNPPVFAQFDGGTGGADTWNGLSATYVEDGSGITEYMVMEPSTDGTLYLNIGDRAGDRMHGDTDDGDESMYLQQITIDGVEYIQVIFNGLPYMAVDPNNNERLVKVLFRANDVTDIVANGGNGDDEILIDSSISSAITMTLAGGAGNDEIVALGGGDAILFGGTIQADPINGNYTDVNTGDDLLVGGDAVHIIYGGDGNDMIEGGLGDDELYGNDGNDALIGGEGHDIISGGNDDDSILGGMGDDIITGNDGHDSIRGGEGVDSIDGGSGDDTIYWVHGDGNDNPLVGGSGVDNFNILASDSADDIGLFDIGTGEVRLTIDGHTDITFDQIEGVTLDAANGADTIEVGDLHATDITGIIIDVGQFTGTESRTIGTVETDVQAEDNDGNLLFDGDGVPIMESKSIDFGIAGSASTLAAINAAEEEYGAVSGLTDQTIESSGLDDDEDTVILHGSDGTVDDTVTITKDQNDAQGVVLDVNLDAAGSDYTVRIVNGERFDTHQDTLIIDTGAGDDVIDASDVSDFFDPATMLSTGSADVIALDLRGGDGDDTLVGSAYADIMRGGLDDDTFTGGFGVDTFLDDGGNDTLIEQFDADMTIFNNAFVMGTLDGLTYGSTDLEGYFEEGVEFEKFYNNTLTGASDAYLADAELELFADGLFENAEITGGLGNNTLVVGDDDGTITIGDIEVTGLNDWAGYVILDNVSNLGWDGLGLSPEYYVIRNAGGFTGTVEINDTGEGLGTDELLVDLGQPEGLADTQDYNQTVTMSSSAGAIDPYSDEPLTNDTSTYDGYIDVLQNGSDATARIIYTDQVEKITIQTGAGDDVVTVEDSLVRTAIELGDGEDILTMGEVNTIVDTDGITVVSSYTPGNRDQMVVYGGEGDDIFNIHYHQATLSLYGENGDDLFAINSYLVSTIGTPTPGSELNVSAGDGDDAVSGPGNVNENNYDYLYNGELNIDGGAGFDTIALVGTDIGDEVVITDKFLAGMGHYIEHANIEGLAIYTLGGDDTISVYSLPSTITLTIKGGDGVDTINFGGNHEPIKMAPPVYDQPNAEVMEINDGGSSTEVLAVPDRVTLAPPQYWLWLGQDYNMLDIAGTVIVEGEGNDDIVNMFNSDNQVFDGRVTSTENEDGEWSLAVEGVATSTIMMSNVAELNLYLGGYEDTVTLDAFEGTPNVTTTTVFTGGGDDTVHVDAILETTNIFTGAGDDTVHVGDTVADKIGATLIIDTDRDYEISTENVLGPDGLAVSAQVMQLTEGGIKLTHDVQLTNHTGWFIDSDNTAFYLPMASGNFIQLDDGTWQYGTLELQADYSWNLVPFDSSQPTEPVDLDGYHFNVDGSHTFDETSTDTYYISTTITHSGTSYYSWDFWELFPINWSYTQQITIPITTVSQLPKLVVEQAVTLATTVTYDKINDNKQVAGDDTVIVHDEGDATSDTGTLTEDAIYGLDMAGHVEYTGVDTLTIELGSADDQFDVIGTNATTVSFINGNGGDDVLTVSGPADGSVADVHTAPDTAAEHDGSLDAIEGELFLDAGAGLNTLIVDDGGDADADTNVVISQSMITGLAPATINYDATGGSFEAVPGVALGDDPEYRIRIYGGTGGNTITVESSRNQAEEYTVVNSGLGSDTVTVIEDDVTHLIINAESGDDTVDASISNGAEYGLHIHGQLGDDTLYGGFSDDVITGGLGADTIHGNDGNDIVYGDQAAVTWNGLVATGMSQLDTAEDGSDTIFGGAGADILRGQAGDDVIVGNGGNDIISGDADNDWISGNGGNDTIFGDTSAFSWGGYILSNATEQEMDTDGGDYIEGNEGDDIIFGSGGRDDIIGGSAVAGIADGNDQIDGGSDRDLIAGGNAVISSDVLSGQISVDARFRSLANATAGLVYGDDGLPDLSATAFEDPLGANERYIDLLDGNGDDIIAGGADDDWIFGQEGNDQIEGDSALYAETQSDGISEDDRAGTSSDGNDYIEGGAGEDLIYGNQGQDDIIGGSSMLFGADSAAERADGADTIFGGSGTNSARYDDGNSSGDHARDADVIIGDNGSIFQIVDGDGDPLTYAHDLSNGEMVDVRAVSHEDYVIGGSPADIGGDDIIHGEAGDDIIYGLTGDDILYGDGQNDDIVGGMGEDKIFGGNGIDGIIGDDGQILTQLAGDGASLFGLDASPTGEHYAVNGDKAGVDGAAAGDLTKTANLYSTDVGDDDVIYGGLGDDFIHGGGGNDAISGAEALAGVFGAADAATLSSPDYDSETRMLSGYDPYNPSAQVEGAVTNFDAYDENGTFIDDGNDRIFGDDGHDWIVGGTGQDWVFGGRGDDVLNVDDDHEQFNASGDDTGDLAGRDIAYGGEGLDVLIGNSHDDQLIDWLGEFNSFIVPFQQFGAPSVLRMPSPSVIAYVTALGGEAGMDTSYTEPFGEVGLFTQQDADARDNVGKPRDPQPGNGGGKITPTATTTVVTTTTTTTADPEPTPEPTVNGNGKSKK